MLEDNYKKAIRKIHPNNTKEIKIESILLSLKKLNIVPGKRKLSKIISFSVNVKLKTLLDYKEYSRILTQVTRKTPPIRWVKKMEKRRSL